MRKVITTITTIISAVLLFSVLTGCAYFSNEIQNLIQQIQSSADSSAQSKDWQVPGI